MTRRVNKSIVDSTKRLLVFLVFSVCVWIGVALIGVRNGSEAVSLGIGVVGLIGTTGACVSLVLQKRLQEKDGVIAAYVGALIGRTVVPLVATLGVLLCCDENVRREIAVRVLIGYFGTAPFHVWATIPGE